MKKQTEEIKCRFCRDTVIDLNTMNFCPECESRVRGKCPSCGSDVSPAFAYCCVSCGVSFNRVEK